MKHAKHSKPLRAIQIALALLAALAASTAAAQSRQGGGRTPAPIGPSYGPVLHPQAVGSESGAQLDQSPPVKAVKPSEQKTGAKRAARRAAPQRVDVVPVVALDSPRLAPPPPPQPAPVVPGPAQINSCLGGVCTDTSGSTYPTGASNAAVSSGGRLCTRSGTTMQCF